MNNAHASPACHRLRNRGADWIAPLAVFGVVLVAQLTLVSGAGTDIPFQNQWDVEGRELYPTWHDGSWTAADLFRAHNEHRIVWTRALDLALFAVNGQWDRLLQLVAGAMLRAGIAAGLAWNVGSGVGMRARILVAGVVAQAFLPRLAWHNALWGFQSQVYFALAGWLGGAAEAVRGLVVPRFRDREAPIRIMRAFQASRDPAVFSGQPLLLVPHPNLESVRAVLDDPRLRGSLPPSLQPAEPPGALSYAARVLLGHRPPPQ